MLIAGVSVPALLLSEYIVQWISPSAEITLLTGQYLLVMIPGTFGRFVNQVLSRFCEAQNVALPSLLVNFASCLNAGLLCTLLVREPLALGGLGAAMAIGACHFTMPFLTLIIMLIKRDIRETRFWCVNCERILDSLTLRRVSTRVFSSTVTSFVGWLADEIGQLLSGRLGATELAAQTVLSSFNQFFFCVPAGLGNTYLWNPLTKKRASSLFLRIEIPLRLLWKSLWCERPI